MDKVRAKFKCVSVGLSYSHTEKADGTFCQPGTPDSRAVLASTWKFAPVYSNDKSSENNRFWQATPSGSLDLMTTKLPHDAFEPGKEYYLDITEVN
jgi:hypothetical protein